MAERKKRRVLPGFGLSLGVSVTFVSLILLLPMSALVRTSRLRVTGRSSRIRRRLPLCG